MKWIFFTLVLLNGFYFTWNWYLTQSALQTEQAQEATAPRIIVKNIEQQAQQAKPLVKCFVFGTLEDLDAAESLRRTLYANGFVTQLIQKKEKSKGPCEPKAHIFAITR